MYNLIIGYNNLSINLIKSIIAKGGVVFLIDDKEPEEILLKNKFLYYYKVDISNMKQVIEKASKAMLLKVYVVTNDDYLNLMIEEALSSLNNVQVIYNFKAFEKVSCGGNNNFYLEDSINSFIKVVS